MPSHTIFYSWQSDLPNAVNRGFIEDCLNKAIKEVRANDKLRLDPCLDRDTSGVPGSPDIAATIFEKIKAADVFVGDVSFINQGQVGRPTPNPNVLVELGYAVGRLGWDKIICVLNQKTGSISDLPFDIRPRRVRCYELTEGQDKSDQRRELVNRLKADITDILHAPDKAEAEALQEVLAPLAAELISILILVDELNNRRIKPWIDLLRSQFRATAESCRHIASTDTAIRHSMATELNELADALDTAANLRMHMGSWPEFEELVKFATEKAKVIKRAHIDEVPLSDESLADVRGAITTTERKLAGLSGRAENMANQGRLDDLQSEPSELGHTLLRLSYYNIDPIRPGLAQHLRLIGRNLHLVETMRVVSDGGRSVRAILDCIRQQSEELTRLVLTLNTNDKP